MLVLTRKAGEKIIFPGLNVTLLVVSVTGGKVRLGIEAPPSIKILREELEQPSSRGPQPRPVSCS